MSAIERFVPENNEIDRIQRIATNFANSGYFSDASEALQAFVKISAGAEMGLQPFVSMSGIAIIKGKPVVGAGILAGLLDAHPDFDYSVTWAPNSTEPTSCTVTVYKHDKERGQSSFSMDDARKAGLAGKEVWKAYSRNMLYARAMSNAVAWYAPSVTRSNGRVFVEGELDDDFDSAPAPRRKREATPAPETAPQEVVIEAEEIVDAAPEAVTSESPNRPGPAEGAEAASTTPNQQVKAALASLSESEKAAVVEACDQLGVKFTLGGLRERFGSDAYSRETLLPALAAAVNPPALVDGEVEPQFGDEAAGASSLQEWLDNDNADLKNTQERLAAAGGYGAS